MTHVRHTATDREPTRHTNQLTDTQNKRLQLVYVLTMNASRDCNDD